MFLLKLQGIMEEKGINGYALRVFVSGGGCSGMNYGMTFAEASASQTGATSGRRGGRRRARRGAASGDSRATRVVGQRRPVGSRHPDRAGPDASHRHRRRRSGVRGPRHDVGTPAALTSIPLSGGADGSADVSPT